MTGSPKVPTNEDIQEMEDKGQLAKTQSKIKNFRPIMFSRNTAMFTVPTSIRDKANLVSLYNDDIGAICTYDKKNNSIIFKLGTKKPKREKKTIKTSK